MDDAARAQPADALRRNQHFGAVAAPAQGEVRGLRAGKARASAGSSKQRRTFRGVGVPADSEALAPAAYSGTSRRGFLSAEPAMSVKTELAFDVCWRSEERRVGKECRSRW